MPAIRMVHLLTVSNAFHARVIAGRLGAEGVVTHLRGGIDGPYPFGDVLVFVDSEDMDLARQLLLADEVEAAFDDDAWGDGGRGRSRPVILWASVVAVALAATAGSLLRLAGG